MRLPLRSSPRPLPLLLALTTPQWRNSMMDGCGVKISKQPNGSFLAEEGQFVNDEWVRVGVGVGDACGGRLGGWVAHRGLLARQQKPPDCAPAGPPAKLRSQQA